MYKINFLSLASKIVNQTMLKNTQKMAEQHLPGDILCAVCIRILQYLSELIIHTFNFHQHAAVYTQLKMNSIKGIHMDGY